MTIVDTPLNTTSKIGCLVSHRVRTVIRYYNFSNSRKLPQKRLELAEAQALSGRGLEIGVVFQERQTKIVDFTESAGLAAGRRAYRYTKDNIGQPADSAIYFSVDFDASSSEIDSHVVPYFDAIRRAFREESGGRSEYRVGAYGSGLVCGTLQQRGLIEFVWLAMSRGYRGTREALDAGEYHLAQRALPPPLYADSRWTSTR
jgi:glycoside hydrolase-like protein